jgi:S-adenosylmethionine-diacylglycerol 3-amino-3-carboxypropyl transferase
MFRSAHAAPPFPDSTLVGPDRMPLRRRRNFRAEEVRELSRAGRVHTYGGFHIAVVPETE